MGELFRQIRPESPLTFTGERMVTGEHGAIQAEHYHRYFLARELCRGKDVLDIASGEGYGSAFLAQTARSVIGVDVDPATVEHASREYIANNLRYAIGDAIKLPLEDHSVDAVVSFETIEHVGDQDAFLAEVKRVLRSGGFFLVSTPDTTVYSALGTEANPYHIREMTDTEFRTAIGRAFRHVSLIRQRAITGSVVVADEIGGKAASPWIFEQRDIHAFEVEHRLMRAPFLIAVASDSTTPSLNFSLYIQTVNINRLLAEMTAELQRLHDLETTVREQEPAVAKAISDAATLPALQAELDRIRKVEDTAREQLARFTGLSVEAEGYESTSQSLEQQVQVICRELEAEREQTSSLQSQLDISTSIARQQALTVQRTFTELQSARQEIQCHKQEIQCHKQEIQCHKQEIQCHKQELESRANALENQKLEIEQLSRQRADYKQWFESYKAAYEQSAKLIVPMRVRSALPGFLKSPFRAAKRAVRSMLRPSQ